MEYRNDNMELWHEGRMVHSHYKPKAVLPDQVKRSIQSVINSKLSQPEREKIIRQGGEKKAGMDVYFDVYVSELEATLMDAAGKHRAALSYERQQAKLPMLDAKLNGLPLTVTVESIDENGDTVTSEDPNPQREGFEEGHVMLDGLPLTITVDVYDDEGNPLEAQVIDNPERTAVQAEYDAINAITASDEVLAIVAARA